MHSTAAAGKPAPTSISAGLIQDPYRRYAALRAAGPLLWSDEALGGSWVLTRYADIVSALQDPRLSSARADAFARQFDARRERELDAFTTTSARWLLFMDAPQHARLRKALNYGFKPAVIEALRPKIEGIVRTLLAPLLSSSEPPGVAPQAPGFDFMRQFAHPLPARVIATMLSVPDADQPQFIAWSDDIAAFIGNLSSSFDTALRAQDALRQLIGYFREILSRRAADDDQEDLVGLLLAARRRGELATDEELLAQCSMFFVAGHETTRNLIGNGLHALLQNPDQLALLRADPELMPRALRELLRYDSPVQLTGRRALEDFDLHGHSIRRGERVTLLLGSGNRDPERFIIPDRLDLTRNEGPHLAFGYGPHVCIGATLSYLEVGIAFRTLLDGLPEIRCLDPHPQWVENAVFRGLTRLRIAPGQHVARLRASAETRRSN